MPISEIKHNDHNLNISRYVSTEKPEEIIDLQQVHKKLQTTQKQINQCVIKSNEFLKELGLPELP